MRRMASVQSSTAPRQSSSRAVSASEEHHALVCDSSRRLHFLGVSQLVDNNDTCRVVLHGVKHYLKKLRPRLHLQPRHIS